jgi:hypothetical protein
MTYCMSRSSLKGLAIRYDNSREVVDNRKHQQKLGLGTAGSHRTE